MSGTLHRFGRGGASAASLAAAAELPPRAPPPEPGLGLKLGPVFVDADASFAFLGPLSLILSPYSPAASAAGAALAGAYLVVRRQNLFGALRRRILLLVPAVVALGAVVWSATPRLALLHAVELGAVSVAALTIAASRKPEAVLKGLAGGFLAGLPITFLLGGQLAGGEALADVAGPGLIAASAALAGAVHERRWSWAAAMGGFAAVQGAALAAQASPAALLQVGLSLVCLAALLPILAAPRALRAAAALVVACACLVASSFVGGAGANWITLALAGGWPASVALLAAVAVGAAMLGRRFALRPTRATAAWIALLIFVLPRLPAGGLGLAPATTGALLLFAGLGAGFARTRRRRSTRPDPARPAAEVISLAEVRARRPQPQA